MQRLLAALPAALLSVACQAQPPLPTPHSRAAQGCASAPSGIVHLEAVARSEVKPDRAVATLAAVRQGSDAAALNVEVARLLQAAVEAAHATAGVAVQTGGFQTTPRYRTVSGQSEQDGWMVRGELILKSADFVALGHLLGQLGQTLQVAGTGTEISGDLQAREQTRLTKMAIAQFRVQAQAAAREFGYRDYALRDVSVGNLQGLTPAPRPMFRALVAASPAEAPVPIEAGVYTLTVNVQGSVQLQR
jgi:predicted secreted protein